MAQDPLITILQHYGWTAVLLYFAAKELWPYLRKSHESEQDRLRSLEERQITAFEKVAEATATMSNSLAVMNERLGHIEAALDIRAQPKVQLKERVPA